ncbi:MAG: hypothetical protein ACTJGD_08400 [Mesonia hippocampi]|uniref:hypothetical protein n=1 Tax=Mesonia hippocampi TaxID=1628250 RepID=UPI003F95688D
MGSNKKDIGKLLRKYGYAMPQDLDEIKSFEEKFSDNYTFPKTWPDIEDIISGKISSAKVIPLKIENRATINLAMAARDGKEISEEDRIKMNKDKDDARKK